MKNRSEFVISTTDIKEEGLTIDSELDISMVSIEDDPALEFIDIKLLGKIRRINKSEYIFAVGNYNKDNKSELLQKINVPIKGITNNKFSNLEKIDESRLEALISVILFSLEKPMLFLFFLLLII